MSNGKDWDWGDSEHEVLERFRGSDATLFDDSMVVECIAEIKANPLTRGTQQETAMDPDRPDPEEGVVMWARVKNANLGILYVLDLDERRGLFLDIGPEVT